MTKKPPALPSRGPEALLCNHTGVLISFELPSQSEFFVLFLQKCGKLSEIRLFPFCLEPGIPFVMIHSHAVDTPSICVSFGWGGNGFTSLSL